MYDALALGDGILLSFMVLCNGRLSAVYGVFFSSVMIHCIGTVLAFVLCLVLRKRLTLDRSLPFWLYTGGCIGMFTVIFQAMACSGLSITAVVALGLLGQTAAAILIDSTGLFGMQKHPFKKSSVAGLVFAAAGIAVMLHSSSQGSTVYAVLTALGAGITIVFSRTVNAGLAVYTGALQCSFINHLTGLCAAVLTAVITGVIPPAAVPAFYPSAVWMYTGGMMGVVSVLLLNIIVPKIPAFRVTLLTFAAQILTGFTVDMLAGKGTVSPAVTGGLLVAAGLVLNMVLDRLLPAS